MRHMMLGLLLLSTACLAGNNQPEAVILEESKQFLHQYLQHLNDYLSGTDATAIENGTTGDIHIPSQVIQPNGRLVQMTSRDQVIKGFTAFLDQIRNQAVAKIEWKDIQLQVLNNHAVLARNTAVLLTERGEITRELSAAYLLYKNEDSWSMVLRVSK